MALYYLKETDGGASPDCTPLLAKRKNRHFPLLSFAFCTTILLTTFVQWLGLTWPLDERLLQILPSTWITTVPHIQILRPKIARLEISPVEGAFPAMDVAMALRGLGKLHPSRILIAGKVNSDKESEQILLGVLTTLRAEGIDVVQAQAPSDTARYHSIALCRYDPPDFLHLGTHWAIVPGSISNKEQGCFLTSDPISSAPTRGVQLFAKTSQNEVVGTTWWEILREIARPSSVQLSPNNSPFWLLGGRLLAFPDRSPVFLTDRGSLPQKELKDSGSNKLNHPPPDSIPRLEEFLLGIEQKERGDNSASFDMQWNDALVVLCKESDRSSLVTLQQLESQFAWRHLSWVAQILLGMGCMILLLIGLRADRKTMLMLAALITVATLASAMLTLRHGILIPWMAPALVSLGLLIQGVFHKFPR